MKLGKTGWLYGDDLARAHAMMVQHYLPRFVISYAREKRYPRRWVMRYANNIFVGQRMSDVYNAKNAAIIALLDNR